MKWNPRSSWNVGSYRGAERFNEFKRRYPDATFIKGSDFGVPISSVDSWDEVKKEMGIVAGINPHAAKVKIKIQGEILQYTEIERPDVKRVGIHAQNMECLVGISALDLADSWDQFKSSDHSEIIKKSKGVTQTDICSVLRSCKGPSYGDNFVKIGKIAQSQINFDPKSYYMAPKTEWNQYKTQMASKINKEHGIKVKGDKWNPADILLVKKGSNTPYVSDGFSLLQENTNFNNRVNAKDLIPLSIKADDTCILGCRGIAKELKKSTNLSISEIVKSGTIENIPVIMHCNFGKIPEDNLVQKLTLDWIVRKGIRHVEHTAELASGNFEYSGSWYIATNTRCVRHKPKKLKLVRIIVSLSSSAVWLDFGEDRFCVRTKGKGKYTLCVEHMSRVSSVEEITLEEVPENYMHMLN